jgi:cyanophycinase
MNKLRIMIFVTGLLIFQAANSQVLPTGSLVIVGGGLEPDNKSVYIQMIDLAGGTEKASFAVIPSASGVSVQSYVLFRSTLLSYGVKPENIHLINIAMVDDDSTTTVDEATWKNNGNDARLAGIVKGCSAVWFTGGDQLRTIKTLVNPDGSKTLVLQAVWEVFENGGVVAGSSAGAAIMSEAMIGGGNSIAALTHGIIPFNMDEEVPEGDGLLMTTGLGFFPLGIVDQHFSQRARIGRLITALFHEKSRFNLGFGIDENTALIYNGKQKILKVAGASGVTIINTSTATISYIQNLPKIENLIISYLEDGDIYDFTTIKIIPAEGKKPTRGNEYYNIENPGQAGVFSSYSSDFKDLITKNLMDNKGTERVKNLSFYKEDSGFLVTLVKTSESEGFYTDKPDGDDHFTVTNILMNITPVQVSITPLK